MKSPTSDTIGQVSWRLQGAKLLGKNPTPYYISYASILVSGHGNATMAGRDGGMIAPFSEQLFDLKPAKTATEGKPNSVLTNAINDYGAFIEKTYPLSR
ncbi:fimbrial biogenesis chaperone [Serratia sp. L9]|uniref:fimbrial biogenesis chaperone n=1 Tax=Serratia sp. L9 TaxID=3423946 RepID=UPI003D667BB7